MSYKFLYRILILFFSVQLVSTSFFTLPASSCSDPPAPDPGLMDKCQKLAYDAAVELRARVWDMLQNQKKACTNQVIPPPSGVTCETVTTQVTGKVCAEVQKKSFTPESCKYLCNLLSNFTRTKLKIDIKPKGNTDLRCLGGIGLCAVTFLEFAGSFQDWLDGQNAEQNYIDLLGCEGIYDELVAMRVLLSEAETKLQAWNDKWTACGCTELGQLTGQTCQDGGTCHNIYVVINDTKLEIARLKAYIAKLEAKYAECLACGFTPPNCTDYNRTTGCSQASNLHKEGNFKEYNDQEDSPATSSSAVCNITAANGSCSDATCTVCLPIDPVDFEVPCCNPILIEVPPEPNTTTP